MKSKKIRIITTFGVLSLLVLFMGQEGCDGELFDRLKFINKIKKALPPPPAGQEKLYITFLSFMNAKTQSSMAGTNSKDLLEREIQKGLGLIVKYTSGLAVNAVGHSIPNNDANVNKLIDISFNPNLTTNEKTDKIIAELMTPYNVDVIITGLLIDENKNPLILIRPLVIVKAQRKILTKSLQLTKEEILCPDPVGSGKQYLCDGVLSQLGQAFLEIIEQL